MNDSSSADNGGETGKVKAQSSKSRARQKFSKPGKTKPAREPVVIEFIDCPANVADRVDFITDLMAAMQWERGKTGKKLAKHWGISQSSMDGYASEASRRVIGDTDSIRRDITAVAYKLMFEALRSGSAKDAKMMMDSLADVSGANAPTKQELTHTVGEATPAKAREVMRGAFGDVGKGVGGEDSDVSVDSLEPAPDALADPEPALDPEAEPS